MNGRGRGQDSMLRGEERGMSSSDRLHDGLTLGRLLIPFRPVPSPDQLAYESHKARKVIASRDISYAFTNVMANGYYSLRAFLPAPQACCPCILT